MTQPGSSNMCPWDRALVGAYSFVKWICAQGRIFNLRNLRPWVHIHFKDFPWLLDQNYLRFCSVLDDDLRMRMSCLLFLPTCLESLQCVFGEGAGNSQWIYEVMAGSHTPTIHIPLCLMWGNPSPHGGHNKKQHTHNPLSTFVNMRMTLMEPGPCILSAVWDLGKLF